MATGKERGYKDWKLSKEFKRSARSYTESETVGGPRNKRASLKKWCKRKVGREHKFEKGGTSFIWAGYYPWQTKDEWRTSYKCTVCGFSKTESVFREVSVD
ncbi:hypothetical protein SEA_MOAB_137 [Streptomyces phage Moab]|nr:hypothetical protein SEA_MOAB_137 [Streptomyces phage Moab]WMI33753.1 hypothetical protein SEA_PATELGO_140 [Streptomyces phage Patelgo]